MFITGTLLPGAWKQNPRRTEGRADRWAPRVDTLCQMMQGDYVAPDLDPGIAEALDTFVAKKKAAAPDSNV